MKKSWITKIVIVIAVSNVIYYLFDGIEYDWIKASLLGLVLGIFSILFVGQSVYSLLKDRKKDKSSGN